jgi:hypothetical protein
MCVRTVDTSDGLGYQANICIHLVLGHMSTQLSDQTSLLDRVNPELVSRLYILENVSYEFLEVRN